MKIHPERGPGQRARLIAYYLPQFHPISENDAWWGRGFTEWTNVAKAKPIFKGHYQPHLPADLGFYDLRVPEARAAQAEMAQEHGLEGFCYWHYWFAGKRLLERPFDEVLKSGEPDFPFCLGWANESWSGIWHGCPDKTLMEQTYPGGEDEEVHFNSLLEAFFDKRYITVDDKPLFYVYKPYNIPDPKRFTDHWRELAVRKGLKGIYFIGEDSTLQWDPGDAGFDAYVENMPGACFHRMANDSGLALRLLRNAFRRYANKFLSKPANIFEYKDFIRHAKKSLSGSFTEYPSVLPNWDNTPRSGKRGYVLINSTPELLRGHLRQAIGHVEHREFDKRIVFIKSWNEWAEGNHLEPDGRYGDAYLQVCRDEVCGAPYCQSAAR